MESRFNARAKISQCEQHNISAIRDRHGYIKYEDLFEGISNPGEIGQTDQAELLVNFQLAIYIR